MFAAPDAQFETQDRVYLFDTVFVNYGHETKHPFVEMLTNNDTHSATH
jgi:hypothetical protein